MCSVLTSFYITRGLSIILFGCGKPYTLILLEGMLMFTTMHRHTLHVFLKPVNKTIKKLLSVAEICATYWISLVISGLEKNTFL